MACSRLRQLFCAPIVKYSGLRIAADLRRALRSQVDLSLIDLKVKTQVSLS